MTLKNAFRDLSQNLESLSDELLALRLTIREDSPLESDSALVDIYGDRIDDMLQEDADQVFMLFPQPVIIPNTQQIGVCFQDMQQGVHRFSAVDFSLAQAHVV